MGQSDWSRATGNQKQVLWTIASWWLQQLNIIGVTIRLELSLKWPTTHKSNKCNAYSSHNNIPFQVAASFRTFKGLRPAQYVCVCGYVCVCMMFLYVYICERI